MTNPKPYNIPKRMVLEAYRRVKANRGAAGIDGVSLTMFEADLSRNLYKLWNRLNSGSYFPPPVKQIQIPKKQGGVRILGIPTVADRIAQQVVVERIGADLFEVFDPRRRILIVDDNEDAANSLAALLSHEGHETRVAYSGRDALESVSAFLPEVALLDIGLPEMDGYQVAHHLRARSDLNHLKLVALTGYGHAADRQQTRAAGFDAHLVKPVDLLALEDALASLSELNRPWEG